MSKRTVKIVMALIAIALVAIIAVAANYNTPKTLRRKWGEEAIRVLEQYNDNDINAEQTSKVINALMEMVYNAEAEETDQTIKQELTTLWLDLLNIENKLYFEGYATSQEVDEAITRIKSHL